MKSEELDRVRATPIEEVAGRLGMTVVRHTALCPFHNDKNPSLHFHRGKNRFKCFACGASGDVVDLVMKYNNVGFREAVEWLREERGVGSEEREYRTAVCQGSNTSHSSLHSPLSSKTSPPDLEYLSTLVAHPVINAEAAHFLFDERKIDPRVVRWCGLTSIDVPKPCWRWGKAFYDAPSLLIPYRDVDGKLITVQGRRLEELKIKEMGDEVGAQLNPPLGGGGGYHPSLPLSPWLKGGNVQQACGAETEGWRRAVDNGGTLGLLGYAVGWEEGGGNTVGYEPYDGRCRSD